MDILNTPDPRVHPVAQRIQDFERFCLRVRALRRGFLEQGEFGGASLLGDVDVVGREPGPFPVPRPRNHLVLAFAPWELTTYGCFVEEAQLGISRKLRKELEIGAELDEAREVHVTSPMHANFKKRGET